MFKTSKNKNTLFKPGVIATVLFVTSALAGCGGGGDAATGSGNTGGVSNPGSTPSQFESVPASVTVISGKA
jgi:hypothetical protein